MTATPHHFTRHLADPRCRRAAAGIVLLVSLAACSVGPGAVPGPGVTSGSPPGPVTAATGTGSSGSTSPGSPAAAPPTVPAQAPATTFTATMLPWRLPRALSRAVALPDGRDLLILGGLTAAGTSSTEMLRINPATGQAAPAGTLAQAVHDAGGAVLGSRFFVFGGGGDTVLGTVQAFAPGQDRARVVGRLPRPRADLSVAAGSDGRMAYIVGGFDGTNPDPAVLDTADGLSFKTVANLPQPVRYAAVAVLGQYLWVLGGAVGTSPTAAIQRVDPRTGSAAVVGRLPVPLDHAVAVVLDGSLLVIGGMVNGRPSSTIWRLDPDNGTAARAGTLPEAVSIPAAAVLGGNAYVMGGEGLTTLDTVVRITRAG